MKICVNPKVFRWVSAFTLRLVPSQRDFAFGVDEKELIFQRSKMAWARTAICSLKRFLVLHLSIIQYVMKRKTEKQTCEDLKERALISHTKLIQLIDWNRSQYLSNSKFWYIIIYWVIQLLLSRPVCNLYSCYKFASVSHENHAHF